MSFQFVILNFQFGLLAILLNPQIDQNSWHNNRNDRHQRIYVQSFFVEFRICWSRLKPVSNIR